MKDISFNKPAPAQVSVAERTENGETEILDYSALIDRCLGNIELAERLVRRMQTYMPQEIEDVKNALAQEDAEEVTRIAHGLKGATANVAAGGLNRVLEEIERHGRSGALSEVPASLEQLHREWERFMNYSTAILPPG